MMKKPSKGEASANKHPVRMALTLSKQAGEEIWAAGNDGTYSSMKHQDDEALGNAFDITWLTVLCIKDKRDNARQGHPSKQAT